MAFSNLLSGHETHRRGSSSSTVKATESFKPYTLGNEQTSAASSFILATLWIHDELYATADVLINESILEGSDIVEGDLIEITPLKDVSGTRDFQSPGGDRDANHFQHRDKQDIKSALDYKSRYLCIAQWAQADLKSKQANLQISVKSSVATAFGFRNRSQVVISKANFDEWTASHVELSFRDTYLARSDMWRLVGQELAGRTVYTGQKITFLGSIRVVVKTIHIGGHRAPTAFFSGTTMPIFRSEAARYVLFIQMSQEMWDFDSEGDGEILFNRVINGFLPDMFKRWTSLEVRHLVSIVLFGRFEYDHPEFHSTRDLGMALAQSSILSGMSSHHYQDFYRVVVTDMASAQWTTILDELKRDFRVFLRDISLHSSKEMTAYNMGRTEEASNLPRINGHPSSAMKGNILEAINMASAQFANDYVDRDLIRTGVSIVVITAGTGVFEVDRDLLNLTSENLTNNGIGIDIVCLSKMPLHSVPLFKYRHSATKNSSSFSDTTRIGTSPGNMHRNVGHLSTIHSQNVSPAISSGGSNSTKFLSRLASSIGWDSSENWCYGIPHWIDLSYWSPESLNGPKSSRKQDSKNKNPKALTRKGPFVPRVRMYEIQMMGIMEMGMADITIPFMYETQIRSNFYRKRFTSKSERSGSRSLSHSPTMSRKSRTSLPRPQPHQGLLSANAKALGDIFDNMDAYNDRIFRTVAGSTKAAVARSKGSRSESTTLSIKQDNNVEALKQPNKIEDKPTPEPSVQILNKQPKTSEAVPSPLTKQKSPQASRIARNFSYALRGLAPPMRAIASTEVNVENVQAQPTSTTPAKQSRPPLASSSGSIRSLSMHGLSVENHDNGSGVNRELSPKSRGSEGEKPSKPISISTPARNLRDERPGSSHQTESMISSKKAAKSLDKSNVEPRYTEPEAETASLSETDESDELDNFKPFPTSITHTVVPFVRNVNPSNPLKNRHHKMGEFGRWQHLYPRKPRAATVKWRSLCTPASVPLTTEDFPSKEELDNEYDLVQYTVHLENTNDMLENPESRDTLLREMLSLRFSHGYQLVIGSQLLESVGHGSFDTSFFFTPDKVRPNGHFVFMSMGNTIQKISLIERDQIEITRYVRRPLHVEPPFATKLGYEPYVRTILSENYKPREMEHKGFAEQYPWESADIFLASPKTEPREEVEHLRFWRARFVLLPVEPSGNAWKATAADSDENEEEIHLKGIRILTQMWQRSRYIPPDERRLTHNRMSTSKRKDRNPLRINMETLNPSELVTTELDKLLIAEESGEGQTTKLLPESEQFERDIATLPKLAAAIQGDKGIEIKNRRWHLRLYYSCFQGEEFTNWLVHNFRDIDTRADAVEFGNDLMKEGLFEHVNSRHNFKDGNYFYSIRSEWRITRSDSRQSWFPTSRKSDRSIPATPLTENPSKESPLTVRTRSGSSLANQPGSGTNSEITKSFSDKKRHAVSLNKLIQIDVDIRKRSDRLEVVNLHYDRVHNPENCYHLELSWLNVTSKLVDDAIVSWTSQAEKYGLKLVEVPISEASKVPITEPFRAPYRIKLASEPPRPVSTNNVIFTTTSFGPQLPTMPVVHLYQKALLKKFNFVLDLEAVSEFPDNVEILYSWGKLDYQYTQFVHRSGVILAQISDEGDILMLANRLYNSRFASTKDSTARFDTKKDPAASSAAAHLHPHRGPILPSMQASGIIGLNVQSPRLAPSPMVKATADVLGNKKALTQAGLATFITPEQIKDELEAFCGDREKLEAFYREVDAMQNASAPRKASSTSSSLLRPIREPDPLIPEFALPEALSTPLKKNIS